MKKLLITLMLISPTSFADWGDVYYCQMTNFSQTTLEGKRTDYILEKFQFKLDKTKNAMVFGKGGYFNDQEMELREGMNWPSMEAWFTATKFSMSHFGKGKFLYSMLTNTGVNSISADCDKF